VSTGTQQLLNTCDPDAFGHVHPDGLFCGDCSLVNARYLAEHVPGVAPDRAHYTVAEIEAALDAAEAELADDMAANAEPYDFADPYERQDNGWEDER
jgi:hypothetical protein